MTVWGGGVWQRVRRFAALMTLLGHVKAEMTMKYVLVAGDDLQREFHLARFHPRHLTPQPKAPTISPRAGLEGVVDSLLFAQHAIEMFRRSLPDGPSRHRLDQLSNRLTVRVAVFSLRGSQRPRPLRAAACHSGGIDMNLRAKLPTS